MSDLRRTGALKRCIGQYASRTCPRSHGSAAPHWLTNLPHRKAGQKDLPQFSPETRPWSPERRLFARRRPCRDTFKRSARRRPARGRAGNSSRLGNTVGPSSPGAVSAVGRAGSSISAGLGIRVGAGSEYATSAMATRTRTTSENINSDFIGLARKAGRIVRRSRHMPFFIGQTGHGRIREASVARAMSSPFLYTTCGRCISDGESR